MTLETLLAIPPALILLWVVGKACRGQEPEQEVVDR